MIIDKLENLERYVSLNPLFAEAMAFLKATDLQAHEAGKVVLKEGELTVNFSEVGPKTKAEARLETHNEFIDIQLPCNSKIPLIIINKNIVISGIDLTGYTKVHYRFFVFFTIFQLAFDILYRTMPPLLKPW